MPRANRFVFVLIILLFVVPRAVRAESGLAEFAIPDPDGGPRIPVALWYPTDSEATDMIRGPVRFRAAEKAPPSAGALPLVVLSHGSGGGPFSHAHTAVALADAGYVVAAPMHAKNNFMDDSGAGTRDVLVRRARTVRAVIDRVTAPNPLGLEVDTDRIAALGFSAGGATALALAGVRPDMASAVVHCADHDDPFCAFVAKGDPRFAEATPIDGLADARVRALVLMAPVTAYYPDAEIAGIDLPVLVIVQGEDTELSPEANAERIVRLMDRRAEVFEAPLARHFSVLPVFERPLPADVPGRFADDAEGFDRAAMHRDMHRRILAFLEGALGG